MIYAALARKLQIFVKEHTSRRYESKLKMEKSEE